MMFDIFIKSDPTKSLCVYIRMIIALVHKVIKIRN